MSELLRPSWLVPALLLAACGFAEALVTDFWHPGPLPRIVALLVTCGLTAWMCLSPLTAIRVSMPDRSRHGVEAQGRAMTGDGPPSASLPDPATPVVGGGPAPAMTMRAPGASGAPPTLPTRSAFRIRWAPWGVAAAGFLLSALIALIALQAFPNSGDEYGYTYLARTFLHGRLWNQPWPADLQDVFRTYYIADLDGKRVSQYPPGWPGVLALFRLVHLAPLANACLGLAAAGFLWLALRRLRVPDGVRLGCFLSGVLAPFTLFTNASYFNHTLTAVALTAIIWLDLRDTDRPALVNRAGIGLASSVLLTTRYETFLIAFVLLVGDRLLRTGRQGLGRFLTWGLPAALAALPITTLFLLYNWQVTGHPFETTLTWASPDIGYGLGANGIEGPHSLRQAFSHTVRWIMEWLAFVPVLMLPLYALALWRRVADRSLRWFDLILPVVVLFFVFYPDFGGFQYGPRYWYFGFVPLPVTVAAGLAAPDGFWRIGRWRLGPVRLAAIQLATCAGFTLGYALFLHLQTEVRMLPLRVAATAPTPALVLIPDVTVRYLSWQATPAPEVQGMDYTRNGLDGLGPLLLGRELGAERTADLCRRFADRHVFRLVMHAPPAEGHLEPACR